MVNVLLAISVLRPEADERHTQLKGPGAEPTTPPRRAHRENADRGGRELPDRGGSLTREFRDRQQSAQRKRSAQGQTSAHGSLAVVILRRHPSHADGLSCENA